MSKEYIEALGKLTEIAYGRGARPENNLESRILEKNLQRLEAIDQSNPSEALECLEEIIHEFNEPHYELSGEYSYKNELLRRCEDEVNTIKQALLKSQEQEKVLKIIFEKNVDIYNLKTCISLEHYNSEIRRKNQNNTYSYEIWYELTREDFNLLKRYSK